MARHPTLKRFDFADINLVPKKCVVNSRNECDTSIHFGNNTFKLPIVPANMESVINLTLCETLASNNYFYIYHRFHNDTIQFMKHMKEKGLFTSISIGVNEDSYSLLNQLKEDNLIPDYITIDIAHGHSVKMERIIKYIRSHFSPSPYIIAGNVSTPEAVVDLESWGANCIKVGIAAGAACTTYMMTGFGNRNCQASAVEACVSAKQNPNTTIISDGGIQNPGDIAKAIALGADMVMVGSMFSGLLDSPGNLVTAPDGKEYKEFWGSASQYQSGKKNRIEGIKKLIPAKHHGILDEMNHLIECLQSSISYAGGTSLNDLHNALYF